MKKPSLSFFVKAIVVNALIGLGFFIKTSAVLAENPKSDSYIIQFGNFNMGAGKYDDPSNAYNVSYTLGQTAAGPYGTYAEGEDSYYFIGAGFQYIYQIGEFAFSISDINIDLGQLVPGAHNTDTNTITISTRGGGGYSIYAYEQYPLSHIGGTDYIPNTTCDTGYTCTTSAAKPWLTETIPGFGFNANGDNVSTDFTTTNPICLTNTDCFRPFANAAASQPMQVIMSSTAIADEESATITYKAGVAGDRAAGRYETNIVFVAVPGY